MKPGNLSKFKVPNPAEQPKDEVYFTASFEAVIFLEEL